MTTKGQLIKNNRKLPNTTLSKLTYQIQAKRTKRTQSQSLTRKWQVRWQNKYVALKINFQYNRIQANIIDSFPATQVKYYLRRTKLDTHGHIARKRLHLARESFFVLTKILEDLKVQLAQGTGDEVRPVAAPILGRIFFRGWNIRLKLRKVIRHIKATYKYTTQTVFSQVAYRTFSRMFSPRKGRRRNRRKKLRSLRRIRYVRQKQLWKIKAIRKFNKRYVSAACTVRPVLTTYIGTTEHFLQHKLGFTQLGTVHKTQTGHVFRQAMRTQLQYLQHKGFFTQLKDWKQSKYYQYVYALVRRDTPKSKKVHWLAAQTKLKNRRKVVKAQQKKKGLHRLQTKQNASVSTRSKGCAWLLHCANQQQNIGRYAKRLNTVAWQRILLGC